MNRFEDAIARELTGRLHTSTRTVRILARWAGAAAPPGSMVDAAVALVLAQVGEQDPQVVAARLQAEYPRRFQRNWDGGPAH